MDDAAAHSNAFGRHHFGDGRPPGGGGNGRGDGGSGGGPDGASPPGGNPWSQRPGCLFGGWRMWAFDDEQTLARAPVPGVAALGLLLVAVVVLVYWFIAR
jgi:hypothetical protein